MSTYKISLSHNFKMPEDEDKAVAFVKSITDITQSMILEYPSKDLTEETEGQRLPKYIIDLTLHLAFH